MHIITGLLISALLGRKKKNSQTPSHPLLRLHQPVRTRHLLPGRARFQIDTLKNNLHISNELQSKLAEVEGIHQIEINPVTGSALVYFEPATVQPELIVAALIRLLGLDSVLEKGLNSKVAHEIKEIMTSFNQSVYHHTNGLVDARTILFLTLAVLGIKKLIQQGSLALPAGFTLLWWATNGILNNKQGLN